MLLSKFSFGVNPRKVMLIKSHFHEGSCLDIGCGNGLYGNAISEVCGDLLQLDIADRRADAAKNFPFRMMDVQRLDLEDNTFDYAVAFDIMEHLDDDALFARELFRVCRKRVILSVPAADDTILKRFNLTHKHHTDKTHRREYTEEQLRGVLESAGFRIRMTRPQYNSAIPQVHRIMEKGSFPGKCASRILSLQILALLKLGLYHNPIIGDWFCVAEKPASPPTADGPGLTAPC